MSGAVVGTRAWSYAPGPYDGRAGPHVELAAATALFESSWRATEGTRARDGLRSIAREFETMAGRENHTVLDNLGARLRWFRRVNSGAAACCWSAAVLGAIERARTR